MVRNAAWLGVLAVCLCPTEVWAGDVHWGEAMVNALVRSLLLAIFVVGVGGVAVACKYQMSAEQEAEAQLTLQELSRIEEPRPGNADDFLRKLSRDPCVDRC